MLEPTSLLLPTVPAGYADAPGSSMVISAPPAGWLWAVTRAVVALGEGVDDGQSESGAAGGTRGVGAGESV